MPELPEVETTVNKLKPLIIGKWILDLDNKKILGIERKGKAILIWLEPKMQILQKGEHFSERVRASEPPQRGLSASDTKSARLARSDVEVPYILAFHQRMSGRLLVVDRGHKDKYIRRRFKLSDGKDLAFHDVRRFGVVWYGLAKKVLKDNYFKNLGEDALGVSFTQLRKILAARKTRKIKAFLLDQKNIAGVGNIMADEILWKAKIHPERIISTLNTDEIKKIWSATRSVLSKSIKLGGSSMRDWFHPDGANGGYFEKRKVYDREGEKCLSCKGEILRKKIAGRSSYYCKRCQPE